MLNKAKLIFLILLSIIFIAACVKPVVKDEAAGQNAAAEKQKGFFELPPSDTDMFRKALLLLDKTQGEPDYSAVKTSLTVLIQKSPQGKWRNSAETLIQMIDNILVLQTEIKSRRQVLEKVNIDKTKLVRENESLKKDLKLTEESQDTEIIRLRQENEQLKKDITLLKNLELQLDKREKMLR